jgi:hypothetical protein
MKKRFFFTWSFLAVALFFLGCQSDRTQWEVLTIDENLSGWHIFQDDGSKSGWKVVDAVLIFDKVSGLESGDADSSLLSDKQYTNFEVSFDWKIEKGGNSGFMWGVNEDKSYKFPYQTGPEIQIIDIDAYNTPEEILGGEIELNNILTDLDEKRHYLGALYDLFPPNDQIQVNPANELNNYQIKIDYRSNRGSVKLNNILINEFPLYGPIWEEKIASSKFSNSEDYPYLGAKRWYDFGKFKTGSICFQDHPGRAYFRNIKIRELE